MSKNMTITAHVFNPNATDTCAECGLLKSHVVHSAVANPDYVQWTSTQDKLDTSLSLLLIDLGESTVVKVERGEWYVSKDSPSTYFITGEVKVLEQTFAAVRDAIDSQDAPVPRIERRDTNSTVDGMPVYLIRQDKDVANDGTALSTSVYDALTAINAGKPLPIYEPTEGKWTLLKGSEIPGIAMYRYTR